MRYIQQLFLGVIFFSWCACSRAQEQVKPKEEGTTKQSNILIVYISRTKNTKTIAEIIQKNVGGDLIALEMQKPYPKDYKAIVAQVQREKESNFLPPLKTKIDQVEKYDTIFIGFPTWGMALPPPMKSFFKQYDLKAKTVIPFNTNAGYGIGSSFETLKELSKDSKVLEGFSIKGGVERDGILFVMEGEKRVEAEQKVQEWLRKIGVIK